MKKLILGTTLALSITPKIYAAPEEGQFAVLKTELPCDVKAPQGYSKSQVFYSKDCSTAFILPGQNILGRIAKPIYLAGSDDNICNAFYEQNKVRASYQAQIDKLNLQIAEVAGRTAKNEEDRKNISFQINNLNKSVKAYQNRIDQVMGEFDNMAAMRLNYNLADSQMDSVLAFQTENLIAGSDTESIYPIRFMPAQIENGVLAVSNPDAKLYYGRSVVKTNFPGYVATPKNRQSIDPNASYVSMKGAISGVVDISASAYCTNKAKGQTDSQTIGRSVALNYYYDVKVQAGKKVYVNATIRVKDLLKHLSAVVENGKYTRKEFTEKFVTGGLENSVTISLDDKGSKTYGLNNLVMGSYDKDEASPLAVLISKVLSNYIDRTEEKLEQLGVFTKDPDQKPKEVAAGSEDVVAGQRQICHRNSGFFGIGASSSCSTQPIIVKVDRDGLSQLAEQTQDNSYIQDEVTFESNETTVVPKSSTFVF